DLERRVYVPANGTHLAASPPRSRGSSRFRRKGDPMRFNSSAGVLAGGTVFYILALGVPAAQAATKVAPTPSVTVAQGGVARWSGLAAKECGVFGKRYAAVDAVCYFPVDLRLKPGRYQIALWDQDGRRHVANAAVVEGDFAEE